MLKEVLSDRNIMRASLIEDIMDTPAIIEEMISRNLFLREAMEDYPYLAAVTNRFKGFRK